MLNIDESWQDFFKKQINQTYFEKLKNQLTEERKKHPVYPPQSCVFNAFNFTPKQEVKVVILGQDPYHGPNQAHGLCFSVLPGVMAPPSLKNIFKEIQRDLNLPIPNHGCLEKWAKQGVLLLNSILTVRESAPMSHSKMGWEIFTDAVIQEVAQDATPKCFLLWGRSAIEKYKHVNHASSKHLILQTTHPSPLSAHQGFLGCGHFSKTNQFLKENGRSPIDWTI